MALPRVLLVDDCQDFRAACAAWLAQEFAIVGELGDARELRAAVKKLVPEVILLDISMPGISGLDAAAQLLHELPEVKIIFLTAQAEQAYIKQAFRVGARGYILKQSPTDLLEALHQVLQGKRYLSPALGTLPAARASAV